MSRPKRTPASTKRTAAKREAPSTARAGRPSSLLDTRIVYCGDCLDQLAKLPDGCVDLIYSAPSFNSDRHYEVFWGETKEKRAFENRRASTQAYIDYMRPRRVEPQQVLGIAALPGVPKLPFTRHVALRNNDCIAFPVSKAVNREDAI